MKKTIGHDEAFEAVERLYAASNDSSRYGEHFKTFKDYLNQQKEKDADRNKVFLLASQGRSTTKTYQMDLYQSLLKETGEKMGNVVVSARTLNKLLDYVDSVIEDIKNFSTQEIMDFAKHGNGK